MYELPNGVFRPRIQSARALRRRVATLAIVGLYACVLTTAWVGCSGGAPGGDDQRVRAAMRMVGVEYSRYQSAHNGQPPPDEAAFRSFLDVQISKTPDYGVKSADELLTTTRDGQPLKVVYGKKAGPPDQPDTPWAAYEQTGVDGKRLVVNTRGTVVELASDEVNRIVGN
jgi:hypothetical protein